MKGSLSLGWKAFWIFLGGWIGISVYWASWAGCADSARTQQRVQRRAKVAAMTRVQKARLLEARTRFDALDPAEQKRLRQLNRQIDEDPQGPQLRLVAQRYYAWLKTLPLYRRAELQELPLQERVQAIQKALEEESARALRRPSPEDAKGLWSWMQQYAQRHESAVLGTLSPERQKEWQSEPDHRRRLVMSLLWMRVPSTPTEIPRPTTKDLQELYGYLSPQTRQRLQTLSPAEQWKLISSWARYLVHYQGDQSTGWIPPEVSEAELLHFFEYELSPEQIDALLALPGEQMLPELRRLYFRIKIPRFEEFSAEPSETALPFPP